MSQGYALWATLDLQGRSSLTLEDWQFLNTRFPVLPDLKSRRLASNNHIGEKYINVRAGKSLTPPKLERNVVLSLQSVSRF